MVDERLKEQYNQSVVELKEALKRDRIFGMIYRNMIVIMDKLEKILRKIGGERR
jgi:hypothetical protein